jgi:5'-3' exonuclease
MAVVQQNNKKYIEFDLSDDRLDIGNDSYDIEYVVSVGELRKLAITFPNHSDDSSFNGTERQVKMDMVDDWTVKLEYINSDDHYCVDECYVYAGRNELIDVEKFMDDFCDYRGIVNLNDSTLKGLIEKFRKSKKVFYDKNMNEIASIDDMSIKDIMEMILIKKRRILGFNKESHVDMY